MKKILAFVRGEVVLTAAVVLAVVSAFFVPPSLDYFTYIDWDTLALLFSLMAVMKGFQKEGLFQFVGSSLLKRTSTSRTMLLALVFLPFFCSMVITNDVSLITFVPFGITVLKLARQEHLVVPLVAMQTLAANLGSMLTPMGNPQNLYLYSQSGMGFGTLCLIMLPYSVISALCLVLWILCYRSQPVIPVEVDAQLGRPLSLDLYALGFGLCLLGIFGLVPPWIIAAIVLVFLLIKDRKVLKAVDYSLLGTFAAFFIFTGNLAAIPFFQQFLASILDGFVVPVSVLASQVISNVPAALLLSGFTTQWKDLIIGCNLGGLGTLIASMASLISYKFLAKEYPKERRKYFLWFTLSNVAMLALLLLANLLF